MLLILFATFCICLMWGIVLASFGDPPCRGHMMPHDRLKDGAALVAGPPCSLMVNACVSVHKRAADNLRGDESNFKVRLSNRIWENFAPLLSARFFFFLCFWMCLDSFQWSNLGTLGIPARHWLAHAEATLCKVLVRVNRRVHFIIEQPAQSWAFKQTYMKDLVSSAAM